MNKLNHLTTRARNFFGSRYAKLSLKILTGLLLLVLLILSFLAFWPVKSISQYSYKKLDYQAAISTAEGVINSEPEDINSKCVSKLLSRGEKTSKAVVLFHGFTNCPAQYDLLAQQIFALGYNVYIPRLPQHGYSNLLTENLKDLQTSELVATGRQALEIASGLGDQVTLLGISGGASLASFLHLESNLSQNAIIAAPVFSPQLYPEYSQKFVSNTLNWVPNSFQWWDPVAKDKPNGGPDYAYPRFSTNALGKFVEIGIVHKRQLQQKPKVDDKEIVFLTVQNDTGINNKVVFSYLNLWSEIDGVTASSYQFPASTGLTHDFIDPMQITANPEVVYPIILERL